MLWTLTLSYNLLPGYGTMVSFNGPLWSLSFESGFTQRQDCGLGATITANHGAAGSRSDRWAAGHHGQPSLMIFATIWIAAFGAGHRFARGGRPVSLGWSRMAAGGLAMSIGLAAVSPTYRQWLFAPTAR